MKSFWKSLVNSTLFIASAGIAQTLVAQEIEQAGIVRISSPRISQSESDQLMPVSATQCNGSCAPSGCSSIGSGAYGSGMGSGGYGSGTGGLFGGSRMGRDFDGSYDVYGRRSRRYYKNSRYSDFQADGYGNGASAGYGNGAQDGYVDGGYGSGFGRHGGLFHGGGLGHGHGHYSSGCPCPNQNGDALCNYLRCKFGYFCPSGGGGQGLPWCGHYARVYPLSPSYSDPRDGQAWAAQGYGVPISVPLAPVVAYTYEYGWGVPSSRIVPISRPAY